MSDELLVFAGSVVAATHWLDEADVPLARRRTHTVVVNGPAAFRQLLGRPGPWRLIELHDAHSALKPHQRNDLRGLVARANALAKP